MKNIQQIHTYFRELGLVKDNTPNTLKGILFRIKNNPENYYVDGSGTLIEGPFVLQYVRTKTSFYTFSIIDFKSKKHHGYIDIQKGNLKHLSKVYNFG